MNCLGWSAACTKCGWTGKLRQVESDEENQQAVEECNLHECSPSHAMQTMRNVVALLARADEKVIH